MELNRNLTQIIRYSKKQKGFLQFSSFPALIGVQFKVKVLS